MRLTVPFLPRALVIRLENRPINPHRWRLRLRTLLVIVLVVGLGLGWTARNVQRVAAQPAAIAQLRLVGVKVVEWKSSSWMLLSEILRRPSAITELRNRQSRLRQATPSAVSLPRLSDEQVGDVVERLVMLPDLEWVSVPEGGLSAKGHEAISRRLPGVELVITPQPHGTPPTPRPK
jgi:hypothetical protein